MSNINIAKSLNNTSNSNNIDGSRIIDNSDRTEIFLDKYRQLETVIKSEYNLGKNDSAINFLMKNKAFQDIENELDMCRETRNLLSHNPKINGEYAVEPSDALINLLNEVINKIENPLRAKDVMVRKSELCYMSMEDSVKEAMIAIKEHSYKQIPILEDGVLAGIFSSKTILDILITEDINGIKQGMTFSDIASYITIENSDDKTFCFVSQDTLVSDIGMMYKENLNKKDRINIIFVTHSGKKTERILGIITAWEIAAEIDRV